MEVVIDAQIIKAYFMEEVIGKSSSDLTDRASKVINRLGDKDRVYLDEEGHIEHEWRQPVTREWFNEWFSALLTADAARILPVKRCPHLKKKLEKAHFPTKGKEGRDLWYVRTAKAVVDEISEGASFCYLISEDMDFHRPELKGQVSGQERLKVLREPTSPLKKILSAENILVHCIATYLGSVEE